jgi:Cu(I)/Ag(I) efflux system periplasmic protein CusF
MKTSPLTILVAVVSLVALTPAAVHATSQTRLAQSAPSTGMIDGEVRKVDKDARKITLRHGEIKQLDMPAMTMVFPVKEPTMLDKVKAGDKVKFKAENIGGKLTVTVIEAAK